MGPRGAELRRDYRHFNGRKSLPRRILPSRISPGRAGRKAGIFAALILGDVFRYMILHDGGYSSSTAHQWLTITLRIYVGNKKKSADATSNGDILLAISMTSGASAARHSLYRHITYARAVDITGACPLTISRRGDDADDTADVITCPLFVYILACARTQDYNSCGKYRSAIVYASAADAPRHYATAMMRRAYGESFRADEMSYIKEKKLPPCRLRLMHRQEIIS